MRQAPDAAVLRGAVSPREHVDCERLLWADAAKGICIVLVVLHHLVGKHYPSVVPDGYGWAAEGWLLLTMTLKPLRMPLFFLLSGFFASKAVQRPWRQVVYSRVVGLYWLYALWLGVHGVIFSYARALPMNRTQNLTDLVEDLLYASTGLWYLHALCLYFVLAKLARCLPHGPVVALSAVAASVSSTLPIEEPNRVSALVHFVYFVTGAYYPALVRRAGHLRFGRRTWALFLSYVCVGAALLTVDAPQGVTILALSALAIPIAVSAVAAGSESWPRTAALAMYVGRRTLPVYVLHMPAIALLHHLVGTLPETANLPLATTVVVTAYPLLTALALTCACLLLHSTLSGGPLRWLFRPPEAPKLLGHRGASATHAWAACHSFPRCFSARDVADRLRIRRRGGTRT